MNTCSTELVTLIIEHACIDDFGWTARQVGLVSKYLRAIAEPIELRTIAVSGLRQLEGAIARLDRAQSSLTPDGSGRTKSRVRHLFVSELTMDHALAVDKSRGSLASKGFWLTEEGKAAETFYRAQANRFWTLASALVKSASLTLQTLFLLSSERWLPMTHDATRCSKVLGVLFGMDFPKLSSLLIYNNARAESILYNRCGTEFRAPATPFLRRLLIASPIFLDGTNSIGTSRIHPLLQQDIYLAKPDLIHLNCFEARFATEAMRAVFGESWKAVLDAGMLPGRLKSVMLVCDPYIFTGPYFRNYRDQIMHDFVAKVEGLNIPGLEAQIFPEYENETGKSRYEQLIAVWMQQCVESFL